MVQYLTQAFAACKGWPRKVAKSILPMLGGTPMALTSDLVVARGLLRTLIDSLAAELGR
jgi:hypothetical protein